MIKHHASWISAALAAWCVCLPGCGEHQQKDREALVAPSEHGTEAEKEPKGPVHHGEALSNVHQ